VLLIPAPWLAEAPPVIVRPEILTALVVLATMSGEVPPAVSTVWRASAPAIVTGSPRVRAPWVRV